MTPTSYAITLNDHFLKLRRNFALLLIPRCNVERGKKERKREKINLKMYVFTREEEEGKEKKINSKMHKGGTEGGGGNDQ